MQTVSIKDIATAIRRPGEPLQVLIDRVQNWIREGLLVPTGEKNPGRGRSRQYGSETIGTARAISVIADVIGMPAVKSRMISDYLPNAWRFFLDPPKGELYLVVARSIDGHRRSFSKCISAQELIAEIATCDFPAHIVIDVRNYFAQLEKSED